MRSLHTDRSSRRETALHCTRPSRCDRFDVEKLHEITLRHVPYILRNWQFLISIRNAGKGFLFGIKVSAERPNKYSLTLRKRQDIRSEFEGSERTRDTSSPSFQPKQIVSNGDKTLTRLHGRASVLQLQDGPAANPQVGVSGPGSPSTG